MKTRIHAAIAAAFYTIVAGCAAPGSSPVTNAAVTPANIIAADRGRNAITSGWCTKAEVAVALGETTVIRFDSGFELRIYPIETDAAPGLGWWDRTGSNKAACGKREFVVLFTPSGVVSCTKD